MFFWRARGHVASVSFAQVWGAGVLNLFRESFRWTLEICQNATQTLRLW